MPFKITYFSPVLVVVCTLLLSVYLASNIEQRERQFLHTLVNKETVQIQDNMRSAVERSVVALKRMADRWEHMGGTPEALWQVDAKNYVQDIAALTTVEWVDSSFHVRWIEPLAGNEKAMGLNIAFNDERKQALTGAAEANRITLTPPLDLVQGYRAVIVYVPLHIDQKFDGFIVGIFDSNAFLEATIPNDVNSDFYVKIEDNQKALFELNKARLYSSANDPLIQNIELPFYNRNWLLTIAPTEQFIQKNTSGLSTYILLVGIIISALLGLTLYYSALSRQKRSQLLTKQSDLKDAKNQYQAVIDNVADGLITTDEKGVITSFNRACETLLLYKAEDVIGKNVKSLMPDEYKQHHDTYMQNYLETGERKIIGISREVQIKRKDDSIFSADLNISKFTLSGKTYFIGIIRDISDRKAAESALVEAKEKAENSTRLKSEFLASMSHEIRTPMNGIIGAQHLLSETELNRQQQNLLDISQTSANTLLALINDILDFSKIEAKKLEMETIPFRINDVIDNVIEMLRVASRHKDLELFSSVNNDTHTVVMGDPTRIKQILVNLVNNAIKFTHDGYVKITTQSKRENNTITYRIGVEDTGIGIPEDKQATIFNKFEQANQSTTREFGGTGLGLAICQQLSHLMGGDISIESEPNKGSIFTLCIQLPIASKEEIHTMHSANSNKAERNNKKKSSDEIKYILVAEDNEINQVIITSLLEHYNCHVSLADDGQEANELVREQEFDLIFMDCQMPVMDGFDAAKAIRAYEEKRQKSPTPIIAFTANAIKGDKEKCLEAGMNDYLSKPIDPEKLSNMIQKWL